MTDTPEAEEPCPARGETRVIDGMMCRFVERELEGDKWVVLGPAPPPIPAAPSDVAGDAVDSVMAVLNYWFDGSRRIDRNSEMVKQLAALIESLSHDREVMREALERITREDIVGHEPQCGMGPSGRIAASALASLKEQGQ
jgi:hypothetical protein